MSKRADDNVRMWEQVEEGKKQKAEAERFLEKLFSKARHKKSPSKTKAKKKKKM